MFLSGKANRALDIVCYAIFLVWNLLFLCFVYAGLLPTVILSVVPAMVSGEIATEFLWPLATLLLVPVACMVVGIRVFLRTPRRLMQLFYGVETPLLAIAIVRLFGLREVSAAGQWVFITCLVCIAGYAIDLSAGYLGRRVRWFGWVQLAVNVLAIGLGAVVGLLLLFYAVPVGWWLIQNVGQALVSVSFSNLRNFALFALSFLMGGAFFLASATLFVAMPGALTICYLQSGWRTLQSFEKQHGSLKTAGGTIAVVLAWTLIFSHLNQQPQLRAFAELARPLESDRDRQVLLAHSEEIRSGLTNAFLNGYRYLGASENSTDVKSMYHGAFRLPQPVLDRLQWWRDALLSPFIYQGNLKDSDRAERLYGEFFDQPLQRAERQAIRHALKSTVNLDQAEAGLLNIDDRRVWLRQQHLNVTEKGDLAEVELHEVYANQTYEVEEVFYAFSLPESATITGLWLGDTDDRDRRFVDQISPRGAAQKVYKSQVQRARPQDPALLEQVGPRQYRLRAFPVPPRLRNWERDFAGRSTVTRPTEMHLWLTYRVAQQSDRAGRPVWPLPQRLETRNIYWTGQTERWLNGQRLPSSESWLPDSAPASGQATAPDQHLVDFPEGYRVTIEPGDSLPPLNPSGDLAPSGLRDRAPLPVAALRDRRLAFVVDTSRSMAARRTELADWLRWLGARGLDNGSLADGEAEVYLSGVAPRSPQKLSRIQDFNPAQYVFFGKLDPLELLAQFDRLQASKPVTYDAIVLVSDRGSYELVKKRREVPALAAPLWILHLGQTAGPDEGGGLATAYDDATLYALQTSGGGVATEPDRLLLSVAAKASLGAQGTVTEDGYRWRIESLATLAPPTVSVAKPAAGSANTAGGTSEEPWLPLAARQLIAYLSRNLGPSPSVADLDRVHRIAKREHLITPYSSAIVLVNDEQRQALKAAESRRDRFDRSIETGKETLENPNGPVSTSIPEASPLLGLVIVVGGAWWLRRDRPTHPTSRKKSPSPGWFFARQSASKRLP